MLLRLPFDPLQMKCCGSEDGKRDENKANQEGPDGRRRREHGKTHRLRIDRAQGGSDLGQTTDGGDEDRRGRCLMCVKARARSTR
ncbi:MAG: hypothetical protein Rubg2KO_05210 [Rubricoccaceae bacterium]